MSHVFAMDVPDYPRPLFLTDAAINISPDLEEMRDIVQNAIDLAHALGIEIPRVAVLSAVETVTPKLRSTLEAAALCKMADRGQITGGLVDGPLAFDNAVSEEAARAKGIVSPVAGRADIFVVPDLESGNVVRARPTAGAAAQARPGLISAERAHEGWTFGLGPARGERLADREQAPRQHGASPLSRAPAISCSTSTAPESGSPPSEPWQMMERPVGGGS